MIYAQILAGGKGTRMGNTAMPKQFLPLGEKPILIQTIEKFVLEHRFKAILVVCPADWLTHTKDIISKFIKDPSVVVVTGGSERNDTLMNGIAYIEKTFGLSDDDVVVTHDAVRPFITERIIDDNINAILQHTAVDTVVPSIRLCRLSTPSFAVKKTKWQKFLFENICIKAKRHKVLTLRS